jgi:hypothetical protein
LHRDIRAEEPRGHDVRDHRAHARLWREKD